MTEWDTSLKDWERRIVAGEPLVPDLPLFEEEADKAVRIFKRLRIADMPGRPRIGEVTDEWVFAFVRAIFGCYDPVERARLIQTFFLLVSKKNTKSTIAAGIMMTALILNKRHFGEFLIIAPTKEIADNSFKPAFGMIEEASDPELAKIFKGNQITRTIVNRLTHASLAVKAADADTVGGQKAIGVLVDELWLFGKKAEAENILSEATGSLASRPEGFVIYLSTQSDSPPAGVFKKKLEYHRKVRDGEIADPTSLQVIYEFPPAMIKSGAWKESANWHITNPNLGRSVSQRWLEAEFAKKQAEGKDSFALFAAKHLNVESGGGIRSDSWPGAKFWKRQGDPGLTLDEILTRCDVVVVGIDGGGLDDIFGLSALGRDRDTRDWLAWSHGWCHEGVLEERKSIASQLRDFEAAGELTIVDDRLEDVSEIVGVVSQIRDSGLLGGVGVDPAGLGELVDAFAGIDVTQDSGLLIGVPQGFGLMNALKTTERKLANGTLHHSGSALAAWCVINLKIEPTATAIRATKAATLDKKIDVAMSLFNAAFLMARNPSPVAPAADIDGFLSSPILA